MTEERQRKSTQMFDPSSFEKERPSVDLTKGTGAKLSELPAWPTGRVSPAFEEALMPLHRIVFGVPGKKGDRRDALADFCGFDPAEAEKCRAKIAQWSKDQLRALVVELGLKIKVSQVIAALQTEVFEFLNKPPAVEQAKKRERAAEASPAAKTTKAAKDAEAPKESPPKQRAKKEAAPASAEAAGDSAESISDDAVRVEVYKRILALPVADHATVSTKSLRAAIEAHLGLAPDALKDRRKVIEEVATECIRAVRGAIASHAAPTAAPPAEQASVTPAPPAAAPADSDAAPPAEEVAAPATSE